MKRRTFIGFGLVALGGIAVGRNMLTPERNHECILNEADFKSHLDKELKSALAQETMHFNLKNVSILKTEEKRSIVVSFICPNGQMHVAVLLLERPLTETYARELADNIIQEILRAQSTEPKEERLLT